MESLGYTQCGNCHGKPLVIIHGWGCDSRFLVPVANMFLDRNVFLIDLPGYGKSKHLKHIVDDYNASVQYLINTLPDESDIISWSFGTLYALHATTICCLRNNNADQEMLIKLQHKSTPKINSLITICGSARFPSDPNWEGMSSYRILKCNTDLTPRRLKMVLNMFYNVQTNSFHNKKEAMSEPNIYNYSYIEKLVQNKNIVDYDVLMSGIRLVTYLDERPALRHLNIPSLHLFGRQDLLVPANVSYHFQQDPLHKVFIFENSGHIPYLSEPKLFQEVIKEFYQNLK